MWKYSVCIWLNTFFFAEHIPLPADTKCFCERDFLSLIIICVSAIVCITVSVVCKRAGCIACVWACVWSSSSIHMPSPCTNCLILTDICMFTWIHGCTVLLCALLARASLLKTSGYLRKYGVHLNSRLRPYLCRFTVYPVITTFFINLIQFWMNAFISASEHMV